MRYLNCGLLKSQLTDSVTHTHGMIHAKTPVSNT